MEQYYKKSLRFAYGKKESTIVAGIAVILMIFHHTFGFYEWQLQSIEYFELFLYKDITLEKIIASFGKICVSVFAFNSGYSLWINKDKSKYTTTLNRLVKFIIGYWLVILFFILFALLTNDTLPDIYSFLYNLIGLKTGPAENYVNVSFAWYVVYYVMFIVFSPIIYLALGFKRLLYDFLSLIILYVIGIYFLGNKYPILGMFFSVGVNSFWGYLFAKYNLFKKLDRRMESSTPILFFILLLMFILRPVFIIISETYNIQIPYDLIFAPLFIYIFISLIYSFNLEKTDKVLLFIGSISMNLWFFHGIFFTGKRYLQPILFFPKVSWLILLWEVILLIPICLLFNSLNKKLWLFLNR